MSTLQATVAIPLEALHFTAPAPEFVSQKTSEQVLGIPRRAFLGAVRDFEAAGGDVLRLGRLRLVKPGELTTWIRNRDVRGEGADELAQLASSVGLRVVG